MRLRRVWRKLGFDLYIILVALPAILYSPAALTASSYTCQVSSSGEYLRGDGHAKQPWSVKVAGQPVVYVESCLIDQLLSFFPEAIRRGGYNGLIRSEAAQMPAAWKTSRGEMILTLSPRSRFQVAASILFVESEFHPNVGNSSAGAVGAFQVLPTTGDQMGFSRVGNTRENLMAGLRYILYIEEQIDRHCTIDDTRKEESTAYRDLIAASYHAGPGHLAKTDRQGRACSLESFPQVTRTEYVDRFRRAMTYRFLPASLHYDPEGRLLDR